MVQEDNSGHLLCCIQIWDSVKKVILVIGSLIAIFPPILNIKIIRPT